ncbi:hypothetical protein F5J12DRAFT_852788 [Pisolithus orientalis]|uniref:uncharacterized protein n=1 Tax=Pisolithus orientalis TaxID=936130 RepID=UPI0022244F7F|nr:uncharacterized protein F5J12DRAFT_852788 [Pisolithus orientalis]KAI5996906.1 hypothetical protein F5J12DRAFT_852788 [Pisolithus orientalis]
MPIAATGVTLFRLFVRMRQGRLWLDDAWAALAMIFNFIFLVVDWLYLKDYTQYPQDTRVVFYYIIAQCFYAVVWSSRISILFTVVRLTFPGSLRRLLVRISIAFAFAWMLLFAQLFWVCEKEGGWKTQPRPQCDLGRNVAITQIITDVLGDMILILAPFRLIYKIRLTKAQKIRLLSIFSTSAITTIVSLIHAYYVLTDGGLKEVLAAIVEFSTSLIVANLTVVVAFIFRISAEETSAPTSLEFKSIITFGSQPIRKRPQRDPLATSAMVVAIETQTIKVDDFSMSPQRVAERDGNDTEAASIETLTKPAPLCDA